MQLSMNVRKGFGGFALDVDFSVAGERFGVFGASGSGKSTLGGLLAGLIMPDAGEITLEGDCLFSSTKGINLRPEQRRIAMVFQQHGLFSHLNVKNNLLYGHRRCSPQHRKIDITDLIEVLQIGPLLEREVENLSGGEKQRVALGRAILANPRLLVMDEPLSALDDTLRFQIIPYLKSVSEQFGIPYLFVSHSLVEMRLMVEHVLAMSEGRVAALTSVDQMARTRLGQSPVGYINLLRLAAPRMVDGLHAYPWGDGELLISAGSSAAAGLFELSSKDIMLFKRHPEAISARNLLKCRVTGTFSSGRKVGVELAHGDQQLIAEVVPEAARELDIAGGGEIYAAIKASAFRRLG